MEAEEDLNIVKAILETEMTLTDEARKNTYQEFEEVEGLNEIEQQLNGIQDKVMQWEKDQSMIWDCGPKEAYDYTKAVDEARKLIEFLENRSSNSSNGDALLLHRARNVLRTAMARLQQEFRHLLVQNRQPFQPDHVSFVSSEEGIIEAADDTVKNAVQRGSVGQASEEYVIESMHQDVITDLKSIARLMFDSNYGRECCQVFINVQKYTLNHCLDILEGEKLTIEDVMKMDQIAIKESKIRRWIRATKLFVRIYLVSEKTLTDQIFGELESMSCVCFTESSKAAILQLQFLSLCKAIAIIIPHHPEKFCWILDMYQVLADLMPDIVALFSDEVGSCIVIECQDILQRLGDYVKTTFLEFDTTMNGSSFSASVLPGGGVHPLTPYVMNYMKSLMVYSKTIEDILRDEDDKTSVSISPETDEEKKNVDGSLCSLPTTIQSLVSILERNLEKESKLYEDESLQHLFLMNNIHYMAENVKNSELRTLLGDEWIRKHNWKFQQHAMNYQRATWSSILALLKDKGMRSPYSNSISRTTIDERLRSFNLAFEEVYKSQSGWSIPDGHLREDLQISTSLMVIPGYRSFVGHFARLISVRHFKYTPDDLGDYIMDLFEGSKKSLRGGHKK